MRNRPRTLSIVGLVVNIVGALLPWGCWGDFGWYCTPGISFYAISVVRAEDNGGFIVVVLSLTISALVMHEPSFAGKPGLLAMVFAVLLMMTVISHAGTWMLVVFEDHLQGTIGATTPGMGLAMIIVGSAILLLTARRNYQMTAE